MGFFIALFIYVLFNLIVGALYVPLPVNDRGTVRYHSIPFMTLALIGINIAVFALWQAPGLINFITADEYSPEYFDAIMSYREKSLNYGFSGVYLREGLTIGAFTTFTSMFMHGDFNHLAGNMLFLWAFGRRVEDACGPWRYLVFYLIAGMVGHMGYAIFAHNNVGHSVGASGAIFGVMGGYLLLFPFSWMACIWVPGIVLKVFVRIMIGIAGEKAEKFRWTIQFPAILVVLIYIAFNFLPTFETIETGELVGGVNYVAHMTGFLSAITIFLFVKKDLLTRYFSGRSL
jgi:membrane associated rhomboid family serine protease